MAACCPWWSSSRPACRITATDTRITIATIAIMTTEGKNKEESMKRTLQLLSCTAAVALAWAQPADARVTRIVIDTTTPIAGQPYEQLTGRAFGELDPHHPLNREITEGAAGELLV